MENLQSQVEEVLANSDIAQLVEHNPDKIEVPGSCPGVRTNSILDRVLDSLAEWPRSQGRVQEHKVLGFPNSTKSMEQLC